jgi:hypothetical protein
MKNDVNEPSKSSKQRNFEKTCGMLSATDEKSRTKKQVADPKVSGTEPRIRIRTKYSPTHNTDWYTTVHNKLTAMLWICTGFNADPDPGF